MLKMQSVFCFFLYFFCFAPFLQFGGYLPSDIQPYAFIMALGCLVLYRKIHIPQFLKSTLWIFSLTAMGLLISFFLVGNQEWLLLIRKAFNYISFCIITLSVYNCMVYTSGLKEKWVKFAINIWLCVGMIQATVNPNFLNQFISNYRTSLTRGVSGLASEPSFYGYMMVFFIVLAHSFKTKSKLYQIICVFQIVFLAQSAVTVVYLGVFLFVFILKEFFCFWKKNPNQMLKIFIVIVVLMTTIGLLWESLYNLLEDTRMIVLFEKLISNAGDLMNIQTLYKLDASVGQRVDSIIKAFTGVINNIGFPHGFLYTDGRIMSGYGVVMYELGAIGIILIIQISKEIYKGFDKSIVIFIGVSAMLFSAVQFGTPIFSFLIGYVSFKNRVKRYNRLT